MLMTVLYNTFGHSCVNNCCITRLDFLVLITVLYNTFGHSCVNNCDHRLLDILTQHWPGAYGAENGHI